MEQLQVNKLDSELNCVGLFGDSVLSGWGTSPLDNMVDSTAHIRLKIGMGCIMPVSFLLKKSFVRKCPLAKICHFSIPRQGRKKELMPKAQLRIKSQEKLKLHYSHI